MAEPGENLTACPCIVFINMLRIIEMYVNHPNPKLLAAWLYPEQLRRWLEVSMG